MSEPIVIGIETSCDETAVGIVRGRTLLANVIASSVEEHANRLKASGPTDASVRLLQL